MDGEEFLMDLKGIFLYTAELMLLDPVDAANRSGAALSKNFRHTLYCTLYTVLFALFTVPEKIQEN